ncbi:hypothetical protein CVD28_08740 [Bacillus sp. M6-12]|uniref:hypothetical protein n=1 Tax=Bacillus sp. M6-12 TaxID=2054166 RepID=UPI000C757C45|nr:hypothetical protein [Bacillus sp. M6-12]PLS17779.1 hypothetical protein CVD28_08740 [Bacillus sp. M6-12]
MVDISMKVHPSFFDEECTIVFSFYFDREARKIGEAVIYTYEEKLRETREEGTNGNREKVAYLKEFSIVEEFEKESMKRIEHFLSAIGIKKCIM